MDHRQLRAFLATARQHRLFAFFHVAAYTGARRGELLNLRWQDIDLDGKKITITGSTAVIGGERVTGTTKSGRTRVVSIDGETVAVLRQRKADQAAEQLKAGDSWRGTKDGYVFTTGWGEPIYPDTVTSLMTKLIHANKQLPHARLHDLRHLHATTLLLSGVPVHVVAARLGHADPAITLRVYAHVIRSAEAAAADIFAEAVKVSRCQGGLLANPLARKPLPRSERACELGAAYRNRTDDLRITRGPVACPGGLPCTDSTTDGTGSTDCTGISRPAVPRPVPRLLQSEDRFSKSRNSSLPRLIRDVCWSWTPLR
jgi:hypothetical protein